MGEPRNGIERIAAERERQIARWGSDHDDEHVGEELLVAAECYIAVSSFDTDDHLRAPADRWPWEKSSWKPSIDPIRNLEKAGALIAAEIDRLLRAEDWDG